MQNVVQQSYTTILKITSMVLHIEMGIKCNSLNIKYFKSYIAVIILVSEEKNKIIPP